MKRSCVLVYNGTLGAKREHIVAQPIFNKDKYPQGIALLHINPKVSKDCQYLFKSRINSWLIMELIPDYGILVCHLQENPWASTICRFEKNAVDIKTREFRSLIFR